MQTTLNLALPRGACPVEAFGALEDRSLPVALLFMDVFGPRPALFDIAEHIAARGLRVLLPHLFYDHLPYAPLDPRGVFGGDPAERQRMMSMYQSLDQARIDADVGVLLRYAEQDLGASAIAAVGYCMGGRVALTAATASPRVVLAASFHGSALAPETPESPHRRFKGIKAKVYVGVAAIDPTFPAAEEGRLAEALRVAGIDHTIETYAGAVHGFVMPDLPTHNGAAAQRHLARLNELLGGGLAGGRGV